MEITQDDTLINFGSQQGEYTGKQLVHLEGLEPIKARPELFIEDLAEEGLFRLLNEAIENSLDEIAAGHGKRLQVVIENGGWYSVEDHGRGIPLEMNEKYGMPAIEMAFTKLYAGGKFEEGGYKAAGGLHGLGLKCIAALSEEVEVDVWRDGGHYQFGLVNGLVSKSLVRIGDSERTGTKIRFRPNYAMFVERTVINTADIEHRLCRAAYLNPGLEVTYVAYGVEVKFCFPGGVAEYVDQQCELLPVIQDDTIRLLAVYGEDMVLEAHLRYTSESASNVRGFVNNIETKGGGSHIDAVAKGVFRAILEYGAEKKLIKKSGPPLSATDVLMGLFAIINFKTKAPKFTSQAKHVYKDLDAEMHLTLLIHTEMSAYLSDNPHVAKIIINNCVSNAELREKIRSQKKVLRKLKETIGEGMPPCLNASKSTGEGTRLYIFPHVNGWHSIAAARDIETQAALPMTLRREINTQDAGLDVLLANSDYTALIGAIGAGVGVPEKNKEREFGDFFFEERRYDEIVLVPDGTNRSRKECAWLVIFFTRQMPELVEEAKVHVLDATEVLTSVGLGLLSHMKRSELKRLVFGPHAPLLKVEPETKLTEEVEKAQPEENEPPEKKMAGIA